MNGPRDNGSDDGLGREAGPDFSPPGAGSPPPPPYGQYRPSPPPYGQYVPPPGRYGQPYDYPPPPRRAGRFVVPVIIVVVVALVVTLAGVGIASWFRARTDVADPPRRDEIPRATLPPSSRRPSESTQPPPSAQSSPSERPSQSPSRRPPQRTEQTGFRFTAPPGWRTADDWGRGNVGRIVDESGNEISIYLWQAADPRRRCQAELKALSVWEAGEISGLPDHKVDGKLAPGGQLEGELTYRMRCVAVRSAVYNITLETAPGDLAESDQAFNAVLDGWRWT